MSVLIYRDAKSVGACASMLVASHLLTDPMCVLGVDYHETLLPVYESLSMLTENGILNWTDARIYQLYEFLPVNGSEQRIANLLGKALFSKTGVSEKQYAVPFSSELSPKAVSETFEQSILNDGGLDAVLVAVRQDGSLLMNTSADSELGIHEAKIDTDGFITAGIATIMQTKHPIIVAIGRNNAGAVKEMLCANLKDSPLAALRLHSNATFIMDEEAASLLDQ